MGRRGAALTLPQIRGTVSWTSLPALEPRFAQLRIDAPELEIALLEGGAISVAGIVIDPRDDGGDNQLLEWLLAQRHVVVMDARVQLRDERASPPRELLFSDADLLIEAGLTGNRFGLHLRRHRRWPRRSTCAVSSVPVLSRVALTSAAGAAAVRAARLCRSRRRQPVDPCADQRRSRQRAMRAWMRFDAFEIVGTTADLALKDVDARLAPNFSR
jgi:hypothetical protein